MIVKNRCESKERRVRMMVRKKRLEKAWTDKKAEKMRRREMLLVIMIVTKRELEKKR